MTLISYWMCVCVCVCVPGSPFKHVWIFVETYYGYNLGMFIISYSVWNGRPFYHELMFVEIFIGVIYEWS